MSWEEAQIPNGKENLINWLVDHALYKQDGKLVHPKLDETVRIGGQTTTIKDPVQNPDRWKKTHLSKMSIEQLQAIFRKIKHFESIKEVREKRETKGLEREHWLPLKEQAEWFRKAITAAGGTSKKQSHIK
jgi:hypothetical protein